MEIEDAAKIIAVRMERIFHNCLPTKDNLLRRSMKIDSPLCLLCKNANETALYLFYECDVMRSLTFATLGLKLERLPSAATADVIRKVVNCCC